MDFNIGDIVEWDYGFVRDGPDIPSEYSTTATGGTEYYEVVYSTKNHVKVKSLSTGLVLSRIDTKREYLEPDGWNPTCFKKVDKFVYRLHEIYGEHDAL